MCDKAVMDIEVGLKEGFKIEEGKFPKLNSSNLPYVVLVSPQGKRYSFLGEEKAIEASNFFPKLKDFLIEETVEG